MFLSIIIPVYNTEKYLSETLESIVSQDFKNYEIIVINDGSTDNSAQIIDNYSQNYKNIHAYYHGNKGVSAARNIGIQNAKGDYIWFIDGDDKIAANALQILKENIKPNIDVLSFNFTYFNLQENQIQANPKKEVLGIVNGDEFLKKDFRFACWSFIYRRNLLVDNRVQFVQQITHFEDNLFNIEVFNQAQAVIQISEQLYLYRQNRDNSAMNDTNCKMYMNSIILILNRITVIKSNVLSNSSLDNIKISFWRSFLYYFNQQRNLDKSELSLISSKVLASLSKIKIDSSFASYEILDAFFYNVFRQKSFRIFKLPVYILLKKTFVKTAIICKIRDY